MKRRFSVCFCHLGRREILLGLRNGCFKMKPLAVEAHNILKSSVLVLKRWVDFDALSFKFFARVL